MSSLVSLSQARAKIQTDLSDQDLADIISDEEAMLVQRLGAHADGVTPVTDLVDPVGDQVFLSRIPASVSAVLEDDASVDASAYRVWANQGRIQRKSGDWASPVEVTYIPADDRPARRRALIELTRIAVEYSAMKSESVAGEYSYSSPDDWEAQRMRVYASLILPEV